MVLEGSSLRTWAMVVGAGSEEGPARWETSGQARGPRDADLTSVTPWQGVSRLSPAQPRQLG